MPLSRLVSACVLVAVSGVVLTGCSALSNKKAHSAEASSSPTTVTTLRTEARSPAPNPPPSTTEVPPTREVSLAIDDRFELGEIIIDSTGRTLYAFSQDSVNEPTCYDACADTWLPVLAKGDPAGTIGIDVASVDAVPRRDGGDQVTYKGIPLYRYAGDHTDRDANGQGLDMFGGVWHVLTKDGQPLA
ncbi:COG4315 family predicted lipoprotein [Mycolicibacterium sp. XJ1819]